MLPGSAAESLAFRTTWKEGLSTKPPVILMMPCGYHQDSVVEELNKMALPEGWNKLSAVREGQVYAVDASSYFSRPGLRLATGVEIMASIFHPAHARMQPPAGSVEPWKSSGPSHAKARRRSALLSIQFTVQPVAAVRFSSGKAGKLQRGCR